MKFLGKEITTTKSVARLLLEAIIKGIIATFIIYLLIGPFNKMTTDILNAIKNKLFTAEALAIIFLPALMVISLTITAAKIVLKNNNKSR